MARAEEHKIREYLLGQLTEADEEQVELRLLTDPDFAEEYDIVVNEVTDDYIAGKFDGQDLKQVEEYFFKSDERRNKLKFALALKKRKSEMVTDKEHKKRSFRPYLAIAATLLLVVGGFYVWRAMSSRTELNRGLAALQSAFREERPLEARLSDFGYAPYITTRGPGTGKIDQNELDRAHFMLLEALKKNPTPAAHHALGKVFLAKKDFDKAIQQFSEALKGDSKNAQLYSDLGAAWLEKGRIDRGTDPGKGMEELGRSLENLSKALELDPNLLEALFNRALCEEHMGLSAQAEADWRDYLKKDPNSSWATEATRHLKVLKEEKQKSSQAKDQLIKEFHIAYEAQDDASAWSTFCRGRSRAGNIIVDSLIDRQLNAIASELPDEATAALKELSYAARVELAKSGDNYTSDLVRVYRSASGTQRDHLIAARGQMKAANEVFNRGEFEQAANLYSEAKGEFVLARSRSEGLFADSWLGYCRLRLPDKGNNVALFERIARDSESKRYRSLYAQSLHALSDAQWGLNQFSNALDSVQKGLKVAEEIQDYPSAVRCLAQTISVHRIFGDYSKSLASFGPAIRLSEILPPDPKLTWQLYQQAAFDFHSLGLAAAATAFELEAVRQANDSGVHLLKSRSLAQLGLLYSRQQKYDEAIKSGEMALAEAEHISGEKSRTNIRAYSRLMLGESHLQAGRFHEASNSFYQALGLYQYLQLDAYAYQAHKGSFLSFVGLGDDEKAESELAIVLSLFENYRKEISDESHRDQFFDAGQDTYDAAVDFAYTKKKDAPRAFDYAEASRARSLFEMMKTGVRITGRDTETQLRLEAETQSLPHARIQEGLPDQVQLLEYAVLNDKVLMWVVKKSFLRAGKSSNGSADIEQRVRRFVSLISSPGADGKAVESEAQELYDILVKPVAADLDPKQQLCIVADKSLNYLPFGALRSADGKYLIEEYPLLRAPSATVFVQLTEEAKKRSAVTNEQLLSVGNPNFDRGQFESLPPLPAAVREARQIASYYSSAVPLVGDAALASRVKGALSSADVIHFATHAVVDERSPLLSKLLLTPDSSSKISSETAGVLEAAEIYQMTLPRTHLVVLSACRTGIERDYRGEGAIGLARPFMAAGVPLVVASLWPVESEVTASLMTNFHKYRKEQGQSTVEALRQAQLEIIRNQQPASTRNHDWAAFIVIGGYAAF